MPVISRITTQQKSNERYNIFLQEVDSETYGFSVDESILVTHNLHKGQELSASFVDELKENDAIQKAYNMAIHYLSYRMRTEKEVVSYLHTKEIPEEHIATVMKKLTQKGLIDDLEFAKAFVSTRINTSTKGPEVVKKELLEKGVHKDNLPAAIELYTYEEQYDKAKHLLQKKAGSSAKNSHRQKLQTLKNHLLQKGFTQDVIKDVVNADTIEKDDEAEWEALIDHGNKQLRKFRGKYEGFQLQNKLKESLYRKGFPIPLIQTFLDRYMTEEEPEEFQE